MLMDDGLVEVSGVEADVEGVILVPRDKGGMIPIWSAWIYGGQQR